MSFSLLQYNILSYALLLPVILNLFSWQSSWVARCFGGVFFIFQSLLWGQWLASGRTMSRQFPLGVLANTIVLLLTGTAVYVVWNLSIPAQTFVFLLHPLVGTLLLQSRHSKQTRLEIHELKWHHFSFKPQAWALFVAYGLCWLITVSILISGATTKAIASPWQTVMPGFWAALAVSTVLFLLIVWTVDTRSAAPFFVASYLFLLLSVALIVYSIGYGFDSFIHQAAERLIDVQGLVSPKTPYYLGQYSLVVSLHRLLGIDIASLDRLLVPFLTAFSLPFICLELLRRERVSDGAALRQGAWLALAVFLMPFASFIVTTPQGLANLFFLWTVLGTFPLILNSQTPWSMPMLWLVALAACAVHPISGIPALILMTLASLELLRDKLDLSQAIMNSLYVELIVLGSITLPLCFLLVGVVTDQDTVLRSLKAVNLASIQTWWPFGTLILNHSPRSLAFELGYFVVDHAWWLISALTLPALFWVLARQTYALLRVYLLSFVIILGNALFLSAFIEFPHVIAYETHQYPVRLLSLAYWSLLPFLMIGLLWLYRRIKTAPPLAFWLSIGGLTWLLLGMTFASYPRNNRFEIGRQYSTSADDFAAVRTINETTSGDYVVLANQSVSAAAVATSGFKTYFTDPEGNAPVFYYPIPTSSPLYTIYLSMVYDEPTRKNAEAANALTGAKTVYFVLNDYWENANVLKERAKMEADEWKDVGDGSVTVFTYHFEPVGSTAR